MISIVIGIITGAGQAINEQSEIDKTRIGKQEMRQRSKPEKH